MMLQTLLNNTSTSFHSEFVRHKHLKANHDAKLELTGLTGPGREPNCSSGKEELGLTDTIRVLGFEASTGLADTIR